MEKELYEIFVKIRLTQATWYGVMTEIERIIISEAMIALNTKSSQKLAKKLGLQRTTLVMKRKRCGLPDTRTTAL